MLKFIVAMLCVLAFAAAERLSGIAQIKARLQAASAKALATKSLPYEFTFTKEQIDELYKAGLMKNPYTGAALDSKPTAAEAFTMADYEGGGLSRDDSAPDKENTFANAVQGITPKHAVVATFDSMVSSNCIAHDAKNPCFFKCLARYEVGHDRDPVAASSNNNGAFEAGQAIRVVPFDFPECECAEGTGVYAGVGKPTTLTFSEATGDRKVEATYDGAKTITLKYVSLKLVTDIDCAATFKIYDAKNPRPVAKEFADGRKVMIDYGKLKPASELQKQMGARMLEAGVNRTKAIKKTTYSSTYAQVLKRSLARELATEAASTASSAAAAGGARQRRGSKKNQRQLTPGVSSDSTATQVAATLPAAYDTREAFPRCTPIVRNQGSCGSCWTFATTGVLSQRTCIENENLDSNFVLSPQSMLTCDDDCFKFTSTCNGGCVGGYTAIAFENLVKTGSTPEHCVAYTSAGGDDPETCGDFNTEDSVMHSIVNCELSSDESDTHIKGDASYNLYGVQEMMTDIYLNGPIQTTFLLENDMYGYSSGVYECDTDGGDLGGHATIAVGWGEENGVKYWIIQNSWGSSWGDGGFFKLRRGVDACGIESNADAVTAKSGVTFEEGNAVPASGTATLTASALAVAAAAAAGAVF